MNINQPIGILSLKSIFGLAMILLLAASCSSLETVEMTEEFGERVVYTRSKKNFAKQGKLKRYDQNGKLLEQAQYENDSLHGQRLLYYDNGQAEIEESYERGNFHGPYKVYFEDGTLKQEGQYVVGSMEGEWKSYYASQQLKEVVTFTDNNENGPFKEFYANGQLKAEGSYLGGDLEHGPLKLYDEQGQLVKTMDCNKGVCRTTWTKEGGKVE
ncbi:MAG: toxin-antitoxin system YwqK family antitoxin [Bacteroidota bacterium]